MSRVRRSCDLPNSSQLIEEEHQVVRPTSRKRMHIGISRRRDSPIPARNRGCGPALVRDRASAETARQDCPPVRPADRRTLRSWPLLVLALPAAVAVWSGWVGIGQMAGFGQVHPLPGIWDSFHLNTAVTLPIGVEAYAAYALRAWLTASGTVSIRTRRFAQWSAVGSLLLGMAGRSPTISSRKPTPPTPPGASPPPCPAYPS
jgi:hypothetical protein